MLDLMKSDAYLERIRKGAYQQYWGPWTRGVYRFVIGDNPDYTRKMLGVLTATEGGRFGAVNMYDRCVLTVGLIQWCEAANIFAVTKMLKKCLAADAALLKSYTDELPGGLTFDADGFKLDGKPVKTKAMQREAFLGGSSGLRDQWTENQKEHAWRVCAVMSAMWQEEKFRAVQEKYTSQRLLGFVMPKTKKILFKVNFPQNGAEGALRAAYVSFAGNLPSVADKHFRIAYHTPGYHDVDAVGRLTLALKEMTFGPGIAIYPHRYNAIRPVLEKQFGIDLPDFAEELRQFEQDYPWSEVFPDSRAIQEALISLGHDLGPAGADNRFGPKSRAALKAFETEYESKGEPDGIPDEVSMQALEQAIEEMDFTVETLRPKDSNDEDNEPFAEDTVIPDVGVVSVEDVPEPEASEDPPPVIVEAVDSEPPEDAERAAGTGKAPYVVLLLGAILAAVGRLLGWY